MKLRWMAALVLALSGVGCGREPRDADRRAVGHAPGSLEGRVFYSDGTAATGLSVAAVREGDGLRRASYGHTDDAGQFTLAQVDPGALALRVSLGSDSLLETGLVLGAEAPTPRLTLVLAAGGIAGEVRAPGRAPAPRARVLVLRAGSGQAREVTADESGAFRAVGLEDGDYVLQVRDLPVARRRVSVRDGRWVEGVQLAAGELQLGGRVLDPEGRPMTNAEVVVIPEDFALKASGVGGRATTDAQGRFAVSNLHPAVYHVHASAGSHRQLRLDAVNLAADRSDLEVLLGGDGELRGRVVTASGEAAPEVWVQAFAPQQGEVALARGATDRAGRFHLTQLRPGSYRLVATGASGLSPWTTVEVVPSRAPADLTLALRSTGSVLSGTVTLRGASAAGAGVFLEHQWGLLLPPVTRADDQGRYRFSGVPGGQYRVTATFSADWTSRDVHVGDDSAVDAELALP